MKASSDFISVRVDMANRLCLLGGEVVLRSGNKGVPSLRRTVCVLVVDYLSDFQSRKMWRGRWERVEDGSVFCRWFGLEGLLRGIHRRLSVAVNIVSG